MAAADMLEREDALDRLDSAFAGACEGAGRVVAIAGEAGAGKTTLLTHLAAQYADRATVCLGACENLATPEPLLPLRDIARASGGRFEFRSDQEHLALFELLLEFLTRASPVVLALEDVHWADAATVDLIRFLSRRVAGTRILVLITYRDEEVGLRTPLRQAFGEAPHGSVERLTLQPLSLAAVTRLAKSRGRDGDEIFALTAGNPFYVSEALAVDGDEPPQSVTDATLARAARLPEEGRSLLEAVSIFPRRADGDLVAALVGNAYGPGLDACTERGMLELDGAALRFRHEIARRAIQSALPPAAKQELHQRVVTLLREKPDARASEVAHHAERAGDGDALIEYAARAAEFAAQAGAHRESAVHYATLLGLRAELDAEYLADVLERHAEQSYLSGAVDEALSSMAEAASSRRGLGDRLNLGRDLTRVMRYAWGGGRRAEARAAIEEAVEVLRSESADADLARAYSFRAQLEMVGLNLDEALTWGERAVELAERIGDQEILADALANVGAALFKRDPERGVAAVHRGLALARTGGYHDHALRAWFLLTCGHYWGGDGDGALAHIRDGVEYAARRDLSHWEAYLRGWRAMILIERGDWNEAALDAEEICGWTRVAGVFRFTGLIALARLRLRRGEPDFEAPLDDARRLAEGTGELQHRVYVANLDAERAFLAEDSDAAAAERLLAVYTQAVETNSLWFAVESSIWLSELGKSVDSAAVLPPPFALHCAGKWREAGDAWQAAGRPYEQALALSAGDEAAKRSALAVFDRLGAEAAARRLRRSMRAAGMQAVPRGPLPRTRAHPAGLTRRQAQVLSLVSDGLSNPEIADRLCISPKTAEHHVSAVIAQLRVASRQEAASLARQQGLLEVPER